MRSEARLIFGQPDITNSNFTESQLDTWANEFYRYACVSLGSIPITARLYTTAATISLNTNTISIDHAKLLSMPGSKWVTLEIIDLSDLHALDPDWENTATGIPSRLVRTGTFTARLYPAPNAANTQAEGLKTHGLEIPSSLSADTDKPDLPLHIQDIAPHWMAYRAFSRLGNDERAKTEFIFVQGIMKQQKQAAVQFSAGRGWKWQGARISADTLW